MPTVRLSWALPALWLGLGAVPSAAAGLPKAPEGFQVRLVASVPAVQYPSQVATAPDGSLFIGEDPMDQVGPADKPIDRILLFRDGEDPVVFAEALNAIFGMVWHDGALYVMNMPNLTVLRDTDGDGVADGRRELFTDLGVPAGAPNDFNDHIVSGLQIGIDNYLYISVGDKGVPGAAGPDGGTAQVVGGGTLRCRLDGTGLEVFSTGTRNHLEPNLDARDNLFTYDNTDDGQGWWTRVTHHVDGGHYGYPYDYHDRPDRMLLRMAEYGGGSPCGGIVYKEDVWPEPYRGRAIWAEWAKRQVRAFAPRGSTFEVADVIEYDFNDHRIFRHDHTRFDVELASGTNRILVKCGNHGGDWQLAVAVTTAAEYAFLKGPATGGFNPEAFRAFASKGGGEPEHGRALFSDLKGLACIKCHAVGGRGGAVGPELSSVGAKYPRDELISAVLYPSAKISMGFEPIVVAASDGRILTGIIKSDTPEALEIEDAEARRIRIPAAEIEDRKRGEVSIMPSGLAEGLTQGDFADLIAYLETLKESEPRPAVGSGPEGDRPAKSPLDPADR